MSADQSAPPVESAETALREAEREQAFWTKNEKRLITRYPDQFVAVSGGIVVSTADSLVDLYTKLRGNGVDPHRAWVKFLSSDPRRFVL